MKRKMGFLMTATLAALLMISCDRLDVVGNHSIRSFGDVLTNAPHLVSRDEVNLGWSLTAPDGSARFFWSYDFEASPLFDVMIEFVANPFITAGLDPAKLDDNVLFNAESGLFIAGTKLGTERLRYRGEFTPLTSYEHIVRLKRFAIGYHAAGDHYGVELGNGNIFEWANDMTNNNNDMVFALNPEPFIAAGVDPNNIEGWVFAQVTVHAAGSTVLVDKLLKRFNLL